MKNGIKGYIAGILTCVMLLTAVFASSGVMREVFFGVQVSVNGEVQNFDEDMTPFIVDGRTFLPVRAIAEALGVDVDFDEETNTVLLSQPHLMEQLMVMFRPIYESMFEAMGLDVSWNEIMGELQGVDWDEMMDLFNEMDFGALIAEMLGGFGFGDFGTEFVEGIPAGHQLLDTSWAWDSATEYVYTFNADGTGTRGIPGMMENFEWSIPEAGHIMMNITGGIMTESWSYTIENDIFTITSNQVPGLTFSYVLVD
ncbi:MAG: copper amine oxidase N-terminal domain-containing protein [Oscillospiraceae bacterium]|nr:copper amine oxidase N-terminal domain-containing protein [Oscillospiraceae bacterium]